MDNTAAAGLNSLYRNLWKILKSYVKNLTDTLAGYRRQLFVVGTLFVLGSVYSWAKVPLSSPWGWVIMSGYVHAASIVLGRKGWSAMDVWEKRIFMWSVVSILSFVHFLLMDWTFSSWESVYYFCGGPGFGGSTVDAVKYCSLNYRWNMAGWRKAMSLWNFVLSSALGLQKLLIEVAFGGLLPGEEAIPRECFVSIIWRLVPFWLNKWESNFGAECSSILFELPHFAMELLIILPMVQIMAGRMRVLARPNLHARNQIDEENDDDTDMVPDVMSCVWVIDKEQRHFSKRLAKNRRSFMVIVGITICAAGNALFTPLYLEHKAIHAPPSLDFVKYDTILSETIRVGLSVEKSLFASGGKDSVNSPDLLAWHANTSTYSCALDGQQNCKTPLQQYMMSWMLENDILLKDYDSKTDMINGIWLNRTTLTADPSILFSLLENTTNEKIHNVTGIKDERVSQMQHVFFGGKFHESENGSYFIKMQKQYMDKVKAQNKMLSKIDNRIMRFVVGQVPNDAAKFHEIAQKHAFELKRMSSEEHKNLVPLVEIALAIMRLSCERWFSLMAVFLSFVVFRDPPALVQKYIRVVAVMCRVFQQTILLSFPAICWGYGAGFVFSVFASVVFWAGPVARLVERIKRVATEVEPVHWHPVNHAEVDRMGGNCAICWGEIAVKVMNLHTQERSDDGMGLECGHAYHRKCLLEWLHSCYGQSRKATCPMCQSQVPLSVKYKFAYPIFERRTDQDAEEHGDDVRQERQEGIPGLAAIVEQMPEEFIGRFDVPMGNLFDEQGDEGEAFDRMQFLARAEEVPGRRVNPIVQSSSSDGYSDVGGLRDDDDAIDRQPLPAFRLSDSEAESSAGHEVRGIVHSAHALIIEDSDSENGSSIHLPAKESDFSDRSGSNITGEESTSHEHSDTDEEPIQNRRNTRVLQGIYARLRPRRNRS